MRRYYHSSTYPNPNANVKRYKYGYRDNIQGITRTAIRRLARRGGVRRISGSVYEATRKILETFLKPVVNDALVYTDHGRRKTMTLMDVIYALKRNGHTFYSANQTILTGSGGKRRKKKRKTTV